MKLIQLNIWANKLNRNAPYFLQKEDADIVNLQEVGSSTHLLPGYSTRESLLEKMPNYNDYFEPALSFDFNKGKAHAGQMILSKFPIKYKNSVFTNLNYKENFDWQNDDVNIRFLQHAEIELNGEVIHSLNYHGYWISGNKEGNELTLKHSQIILDYMKTLKGKVILTGDFNLLPDSPSIEIISKEYRNLSTEYKIKTTRNFLCPRPVEVIDYIFVNNEVEVKDFKVAEEIVSDHQALIMEFE